MYEILLTDPRTDSTVELTAPNESEMTTAVSELRNAAVESSEVELLVSSITGVNYVRVDITAKDGETILIIRAYRMFRKALITRVH